MTNSKNMNDIYIEFFILDKLKEMEIESPMIYSMILLLYSIPGSQKYTSESQSNPEMSYPLPRNAGKSPIEEANARKNKEIPIFHDSQRALHREKKYERYKQNRKSPT
ncbi:hypothetical protein AVEN_42895-1 [Araneus ventricosus]|uniref:Uncharacterized protein n=1 Tax=Araneus ventricosus TaxID=182803 RepID=A0A4Y2AGK6_ARAVE|nr:hypothetical protein AVEN_42895-1 [Araneus ventricosus]